MVAIPQANAGRPPACGAQDPMRWGQVDRYFPPAGRRVPGHAATGNDTIRGFGSGRREEWRFVGGIIFAIAIALATLACIGIVVWTSEY
jgi:hypothetical protein